MIIFIDPGKTGGAIIVHKGEHVKLVPWTSVEKVGLIVDSYPLDRAVIEKVHGSSSLTPAQVFEFGRNLGQWEGILYDVEKEYVSPKTWQKPLGMPRNLTYSQRKTWLYRKSVEWVGKKNTNRACCDAWLIAKWWGEKEGKR